jgi:hypothetical protein
VLEVISVETVAVMATSKSVLIAVRVSQEIASALDRLGQGAKIHTPMGPVPLPAQTLTRTEALRIAAEVGLRAMGLLASDIQSNNGRQQEPLTAPATPSLVVAPASPASASKQAGAPESLSNAVLAAIRATAKAGSDVFDVAPVVRQLEERGYKRAAIHAEIMRLGTAGVDVIELRPDSGGGFERKEERDIVPRGREGNPFLQGRLLLKTPPVDALLVRYNAAIAEKKTSARKAAPIIGAGSPAELWRWARGESELSDKLRVKLSKYLDAL